MTRLAERVAYFFFFNTPASSSSDHSCSHTAAGGSPATPLAAQCRAASARHWIASARTAASSTFDFGGRGAGREPTPPGPPSLKGRGEEDVRASFAFAPSG